MGSKRSEIKEENPLQELLNAIISSLEPLEARIEAVYQFLKAKGGASDKDLAPFLEQSANASNVRWRAFRVRAEALIAGALKDREKESKAEQSEPESESRKPQATESEKAETQDDTKATQTKAQTDETLAARIRPRSRMMPSPRPNKASLRRAKTKLPRRRKLRRRIRRKIKRATRQPRSRRPHRRTQAFSKAARTSQPRAANRPLKCNRIKSSRMKGNRKKMRLRKARRN